MNELCLENITDYSDYRKLGIIQIQRYLDQWFSQPAKITWLAASASPGTLIEKQIPRTYPRPIESETLEVGPRSLFFYLNRDQLLQRVIKFLISCRQSLIKEVHWHSKEQYNLVSPLDLRRKIKYRALYLKPIALN